MNKIRAFRTNYIMCQARTLFRSRPDNEAANRVKQARMAQLNSGAANARDAREARRSLG